MTCPTCGAVWTAEAKFCSQCGSPREAIPSATPARPKWYYNIWFTLAMLFFVLGPLGLPLVWKNPNFSRWVKLVLTLAMVAYTVLLIDVTLRAIRAVTEQLNQFNSTLQF